MSAPRTTAALVSAALSLAATSLAACDTETATSSVVENAFPAAAPDGGNAAHGAVVYRAWWVATYFPDPVPGGATSAAQRTVPASDYAYAVLAPGWDPASTTPPTSFVVLKSKAAFSVARGDVLHIVVSDETFAGNCGVGQPLSQADADFITQSIFPGEFANVVYDAKTCTTTAIAAPDTDAEAGPDAGSG